MVYSNISNLFPCKHRTGFLFCQLTWIQFFLCIINFYSYLLHAGLLCAYHILELNHCVHHYCNVTWITKDWLVLMSCPWKWWRGKDKACLLAWYPSQYMNHCIFFISPRTYELYMLFVTLINFSGTRNGLMVLGIYISLDIKIRITKKTITNFTLHKKKIK